MSTHVVGIRPPDEQWQRMKAVWDSCVLANVTPPEGVANFFNGQEPDPAGIVMPLDSTFDGGIEIAREYRGDMTEGVEIDIASLPAQITTIRFYNSW